MTMCSIAIWNGSRIRGQPLNTGSSVSTAIGTWIAST